jgi:hypothetical protein
MPDPKELAQAGVHSSYVDWLQHEPESGEVFVDTGAASAVDSRKLHWSPTTQQRDELSVLMRRQVDDVKRLFERGDPDAFAANVDALVGKALSKIGVDPEKFGVSRAIIGPGDRPKDK